MVARLMLVIWCGLAVGCATSGAVPRPFPSPAGSPPPARQDGEAATGTPGRADSEALVDGYSVSSTALSLRGAPYRPGGTDPGGFDCSGFVKYVFGQHGIALPREVRQLFGVGRTVAAATLEPGDLVFFTTVAPGASHVGIAIGGDQFVHAPSSRGVVRVEALSAAYWSDRFVGARRVE